MYLFIFIYGLLNEAVSNSDYVASIGELVTEW
jgi:hypothetical protein